jgi:hypothetical protein
MPPRRPSAAYSRERAGGASQSPHLGPAYNRLPLELSVVIFSQTQLTADLSVEAAIHIFLP